MSESSWIKLSVDSNYFVAGDRLTGEVVVNNVLPGCIIILKSQGTEQVTIQHPNTPEKHFTNPIYALSEELAQTTSSQAVYPFAFPLPQFSPATFDFQDVDHSGTKIKAEVFYTLEAHLLCASQTLQRDNLKFIVFNKASRVVFPQSVDFVSPLSSCWCVPRGNSQIVIESIEKAQAACKDIKKFSIGIKSPANTSLESSIAQIVHDVDFLLPGEKALHCRKIISRFVPNILEMKNQAKNVESLEFAFEADLGSAGLENAASNNSVLFNSVYKVQVFGIYDVGFRSKRSEGESVLHVNPVVVKLEKVILPEEWEPNEHHLKSFMLDVSSAYKSADES